jgi:hypothetical protein
MGYCITQTDSSFFIPKELFGPALQSILSIMTEETSGEVRQIRNFSWVNTDKVLVAKTLPDALRAWRWSPTLDEDDNIIDLQFNGEKEGDDYTLFGAIAPYVKEESSISMAGEDHYRWRWFFDGRTVYEQKGMITYI